MKRSVHHRVLLLGAIVLLALVPMAVAQGNKAPKITDLTTTLDDGLSVTSDGGGSYPAVFASGYFQLDLARHRWINVDFRLCAEASDCSRGLGGIVAARASLTPTLNAHTKVENFEVGYGALTHFRIGFLDENGQEWALQYFGDTACGELSSQAYAYREDDYTWTFDTRSGDLACLQKISRKGTRTPSGLYQVPFFLRAVKPH